MRESSALIDVRAMNGAMDKHEMTSGVIPLRHASLPGHVKLPRRYEKAAMGTNGIPVRLRKISIQPGQRVLGDSLSDRLEDLMSAILWVKQELIMLRQHDILLKRQFFDIHHSIQTLHKTRPPPSPAHTPNHTHTPTPNPICPNPSPTSPTDSTTTPTPTNETLHCPRPLMNGDALLEEEEEEEEGEDGVEKTNGQPASAKDTDYAFDGDDFVLETFVVRPSSSVTLLKEDSEEEEGEERDRFCEDLFFRPRTSSMRTSRDMAALARRRGSKELI